MELSPYELLRLERIKRNAERLKELGLDQNPLKKAKQKKRKLKKVEKIGPVQQRRSKRLSSKKNDGDLVMLDYRAKDGEEIVTKQDSSGFDSDVAPQQRVGTIFRKKSPETGKYHECEVIDYDEKRKCYRIKYLDGREEDFDEENLTLYRRVGTFIRKKFPETGKYHEGKVIEYDNISKWYRVKYSDGQEEDLDVETLKQYRVQKLEPSKTRNNHKVRQKARSSKLDTEQWKLSEEDRASLSSADESFLEKFQEFLEYENRISEQNKRNVMRQVRKLASGEGIRYESAAYGWPEGCYFKKGEKITPMSDVVELMVEGQACEDKWGRDHGNGWLISHPLKKLLLFQQFILKNPDFLSSELRLKDYCE